MTARVPLALALTLTALGTTSGSSSPAAAQIKECGEIRSEFAYNITARVVGCAEARRVARGWNGRGNVIIRGLRCRYRDTGYEAGDIRCAGSRGRVVRWQTYS